MSTIHQQEDGRYLVAVKGAPDVLLGRTSKVLLDGQELPMTNEEKEKSYSTIPIWRNKHCGYWGWPTNM